jgi:predicted RNase H-like HicB family nuclease
MSENIKKYIAVINKENGKQYGVIFPDFLGCVTVGKNLEEAKEMAQEALQFHVDGMLKDGEDLPYGKSLDEIKKKYKKAEIFLVVAVKIKTKATRINISIDEKLLRKLDKFLLNRNETRSSFFAKSIVNHVKFL